MAEDFDDENEDDRFEVLPAGEMREKYGLYAEAAPKIHLDHSKVPVELHPLIPLAEKWGISDDLIRADFAAKAGEAAVRELAETLRAYDDALDAWLAGSEVNAPELSKEYIAFSCMRMAGDGC